MTFDPEKMAEILQEALNHITFDNTTNGAKHDNKTASEKIQGCIEELKTIVDDGK